jgi:hypothetical protein
LWLKFGIPGERFNPLNAKLNPIRHLLALAGVRHFVHISRIRVNKTIILPAPEVHSYGEEVIFLKAIFYFFEICI